MLHGNLGQDALESAALIGRPAAEPLIVVDDQDAIPGPSPGGREVGEGILPFSRFAMVEDLLGIGLTHVNNDDKIEMPIQDLEGSQDAGQVDRLMESRCRAGDPFGGFGRITNVHDRPPCRREALAVVERRCG